MRDKESDQGERGKPWLGGFWGVRLFGDFLEVVPNGEEGLCCCKRDTAPERAVGCQTGCALPIAVSSDA